MTKEEMEITEKENIVPYSGLKNGYVDWEDLDLEDNGDPLMVSDYVVEIFDYMSHLEVNFVYSVFIVIFMFYLYACLLVCSFVCLLKSHQCRNKWSLLIILC